MNEVTSFDTAKQHFEQINSIYHELINQGKYIESSGLSELIDSKVQDLLETPSSNTDDMLYKLQFSIDTIDDLFCYEQEAVNAINKAYDCIKNNSFVEAREILNNLIAEYEDDFDDFVLEGAIAALKDLNQFH